MSENKDLHNSGGLFAFLASLGFVICFFGYLVFVNTGVKLDENVVEPAAAGAPVFKLSDVKEPWVSTPEILTAGQKIFKQNCAVCHGEKGDLVGGLPNARNLVEGKWKTGAGLIHHFKVLQDGLPGTQMVSFKATLKPNERWAVAHFVESITNNKGSDKPEDIATFAASAD